LQVLFEKVWLFGISIEPGDRFTRKISMISRKASQRNLIHCFLLCSFLRDSQAGFYTCNKIWFSSRTKLLTNLKKKLKIRYEYFIIVNYNEKCHCI